MNGTFYAGLQTGIVVLHDTAASLRQNEMVRKACPGEP
jgi:hypothetical protein